MQPISGEFGDTGEYEFIPEQLESSEQVRGYLFIDPGMEPNSYDVPGFIEFSQKEWSSGRIEVVISDGDQNQGTIYVETEDGHELIPVLSAPVHYAVVQVLKGNIEDAISLIQDNYGNRWAWGFRNDCRDTLCYEAYVEVLNTLAAHSDKFGYAQIRSGLGYFAKRIREDSQQGIWSFETLECRVSQWNKKEHLSSVTIGEVIGEKLGRNQYRSGLEFERKELIDIRFEPENFDPEWDSVAPACWIAHIIVSEGINSARQFVDDRPIPKSGNYRELKETAKKEQTGEIWGSVLAKTLEQSSKDFEYDAFNYLKNTADDYHGKGKFAPLLYEGAELLMPDYLPDYLLQTIKTNKQLSIGHNWRRDGQTKRSKEAFEQAKEVARGGKNHDFNAFLFVEAESSLTYTTTKLESEIDKKYELYETGIRNIRNISSKFEIPDWKINKAVEFLEGRRNKETERNSS